MKSLFSVFFYILSFLLATITLTNLFCSYKYFQIGEAAQAYLTICLNAILFCLALFYLTFSMYIEERKKNNLRQTFSPFEFLYKKMRLNK